MPRLYRSASAPVLDVPPNNASQYYQQWVEAGSVAVEHSFEDADQVLSKNLIKEKRRHPWDQPRLPAFRLN